MIKALGGSILFLFLAACRLAPAAPTGTTTPPDTPTPAPITVLADPNLSAFQAEIILEEGRCCAGGTMGHDILVRAAYIAASPTGAVTHLRTMGRYGGGCAAQEEMDQLAWKPYMAEEAFPVTLRSGFVGFYLTAQFADDQGNLSPVVCADISVEGMPPRTP